MHVEAVIAALRQALALVATIAQYTATTLDDKLVRVGQAIIDNGPLIELLTELLDHKEVLNRRDGERTATIQDVALAKRSPAVTAALDTAGIDWQTFINTLPAIVRLVMTLLNRRSVKVVETESGPYTCVP